MNRAATEYRPYRAETDRDRSAQIVSHAFGTSPELSLAWLDHVAKGFRVLTRAEQVVATTLLYDCGQFFGGRSVPMLGVAGVAVAAEARGRGAAREIMSRCVHEMRELGAPISSLYPATQKLYQSVGYEQAGHHFEHRVPTDAFEGGSAELEVEILHDEDRPEVEALYRQATQHQDGHLDRDEVLWGRVFKPRGNAADPYVVREEGGPIEGYLVLLPRHHVDDGRTQVLTDVQFTTERAGRRIMRFLRDHSSTVRTISFHGGPQHPLGMLLSEQRYEVKRRDYWMTRLLDVPAALEARGYRPGLSARLTIGVRDELLPANDGAWTIEVEDGAARVTLGGNARIRLHVRDLASLYTGFASPQWLCAIGRLECPDEVAEELGSLFAGPAPAMVEQF